VNRVASTKQWAPHRPSLASSPLLSLCQDLYRGVVRACPGARGQGGSRHDGVARASTRAESPAQPLLNLMADAVSMSRPGRGWGVGGGVRKGRDKQGRREEACKLPLCSQRKRENKARQVTLRRVVEQVHLASSQRDYTVCYGHTAFSQSVSVSQRFHEATHLRCQNTHPCPQGPPWEGPHCCCWTTAAR
jgi:hypothetical protein